MELYEPIELGPLSVERLSLTFVGLRFPVDLSGGVPRFRSRRGELQEVVLRVRLPELAAFAARRVGEPFGPLAKPPAVFAIEGGIGVGLVGERGALAFDLLWAADEGDARWVVSNARGVGLPGPALAIALRASEALVQGYGERRGRVLEIADVGGRIGRALLPAVGARAPSAAAVRFGDLFHELDELSVALDATFPPAAPSAHATRALELAELTREADEALAASQLDEARAHLLEALEQAPRHPEIVRTLCEIDSAIPGRFEAALGMLVETLPAALAGELGATLLAGTGDSAGALSALERAASVELYAPLAALLLLRAAEIAPPAFAQTYLDRAVSTAPTLPQLRRARFLARLARGEVDLALADAEHLEAMASGAKARHAACVYAAERLLEAGNVKQAGKAFERALRYAPDDADATAGLARALESAGSVQRAIALYERAIAIAERTSTSAARAQVELSRLLADSASDLPGAIARARQVPVSAKEAEQARWLEARYRARLGDLAGASLAFARLREVIELGSGSAAGESAERLREAAEFELGARDDPALAERHLALALRLQPHDAELARLYRHAAELFDARRRAR
jgi:tetratricopeptide (TPR) repeat protein